MYSVHPKVQVYHRVELANGDFIVDVGVGELPDGEESLAIDDNFSRTGEY